jgi:hypothetical protein
MSCREQQPRISTPIRKSAPNTPQRRAPEVDVFSKVMETAYPLSARTFHSVIAGMRKLWSPLDAAVHRAPGHLEELGDLDGGVLSSLKSGHEVDFLAPGEFDVRSNGCNCSG